MLFDLLRSPVQQRGFAASALMATAVAGFWGAAAFAAEPAPAPAPTQSEMAADFLASVRGLIDDFTKNPGTVVAEIGDHPITRGDVAEALRTVPATDGGTSLEALYRNAVQGLMAQQAMVIRAKEQGIDKDPAVARRIETTVNTILANEYLRRVIAPAVTDQMLHAAYDREFAGKPGAEQVRASVIMTNTEQEARDVLAELSKGADFATVARSTSKDASAKASGDLGFVSLDAVSPAIGGVMFSLTPGQTSAFPVRVAPNAWFIVKVEARRQQAAPSFESVRNQLVQEIMRESAPAAIQKAVAGLPARDYGMTGKPAAAAPAH